MSNCGSRPKKMKYGGKVKGFEQGGSTISDADKQTLEAIIRGIEGTEKTISDSDKRKMMRKFDKSERDTTEALPEGIRKLMGYQKGGKVKGYMNGGCVMKGRGGKFKGIS